LGVNAGVSETDRVSAGGCCAEQLDVTK